MNPASIDIIRFLGTRWSWLKLLQKFLFDNSIDFTSMLLLNTHNCLALAQYSILFLGTRWSCLKLLQKFFFEISIDFTSMLLLNTQYCLALEGQNIFSQE